MCHAKDGPPRQLHFPPAMFLRLISALSLTPVASLSAWWLAPGSCLPTSYPSSTFPPSPFRASINSLFLPRSSFLSNGSQNPIPSFESSFFTTPILFRTSKLLLLPPLRLPALLIISSSSHFTHSSRPSPSSSFPAPPLLFTQITASPRRYPTLLS